ncbi:conserved protein of unknown function [Pseudodesulfovibrio profundus]|uniref:DUF1641 domain-containing protein n=1 Tax=Pseudodesulfovibrio profundus TaxID=57320 RepID=A0A2C8FE36_9BACT|nr:DUF1641 domain-containing protein [Pseudodesulfovibrio profundus]SOB60154.1 conserved protein of unknown function [Pseudodesulfovibrio profundus]
MTNEAIMERLDKIEENIAFLTERAKATEELKNDLSPIVHDGFKVLMHEFGSIEHGFQLEDLTEFIKKAMVSFKNMTYMLDKMEDAIDLWKTIEPLMHSSVPQLIQYMDSLEQRGVFDTYRAMIEIRAQVAETYGPENLRNMGDSFVFLIGMLEKLGDPKVRMMIEGAANAFSELDLTEVKPTGPIGMVSGMASKDAKRGLGVMLEMTKTLGKIGLEVPKVDEKAAEKAAMAAEAAETKKASK